MGGILDADDGEADLVRIAAEPGHVDIGSGQLLLDFDVTHGCGGAEGNVGHDLDIPASLFARGELRDSEAGPLADPSRNRWGWLGWLSRLLGGKRSRSD